MANLTNMQIISLGDLESNLGRSRLTNFVHESEQAFHKQIKKITQRILKRKAVKVIFVSGPTSSGKTTFSELLAQALTEAGRYTRLVSMDDYYLLKDILYDEEGRPDFESIDMLDIPLFMEHLSTLLEGGELILPKFSFLDRSRSWPQENQIQIGPEDLLIVEGLHGLSPTVYGKIKRKHAFGVFIMPWCSFLDGRQLLGSRDLRVLRRVSRDVSHRGSSAMATIDYWPMIERSEHFIPLYLANADVYVNSCLPYEFGVIAPSAAYHIGRSLEQFENNELEDSVFLKHHPKSYADLETAVAEARSLYAACLAIPQISKSFVPENSLLNEFV